MTKFFVADLRAGGDKRFEDAASGRKALAAPAGWSIPAPIKG
jgi:hypothetical protein